jgi:murein DD-endopeptidase MepM/ murein hydrolase activator NlpD
VRHADGFYTEYANLDEDIKVAVNDKVSAGQVLGEVGTTALYEIADAPHVHFAVIVNEVYVDPAEYLSF